MGTSVRLLYVTTPTYTDAQSLAEILLNEKLIACANITQNMESMYWWKGHLERAQECVLILKTTREKVDQVILKVKTSHPYEVPCILTIPVESGNEAYLQWLTGEVL